MYCIIFFLTMIISDSTDAFYSSKLIDERGQTSDRPLLESDETLYWNKFLIILQHLYPAVLQYPYVCHESVDEVILGITCIVINLFSSGDHKPISWKNICIAMQTKKSNQISLLRRLKDDENCRPHVQVS